MYSTVCVLTDSDSVCTVWGTAVPMDICVIGTDLDRLYSTVCVLTDSDSVCTARGTAVPMDLRILRTDLDRSSD